MSKILIGICDMGNGHISRQSCVISALIEKGHDVLTVIGKGHADLLKSMFPQVPFIISSRPYIYNDENGTDFRKTYQRYLSEGTDYNRIFLETALAVEDYFGGKPDLVIEDYEPVVAKYAFLEQIRLICMEQQSKYIYIDDVPINGYSINEEVCRLEYFFPRYEKRIISSFFPIAIKSENVCVIPPIVEDIPKSDKKDPKKIVFYLSTFSGDVSFYRNVLDEIAACTNYDFYVYTQLDFEKEYPKNFTFLPISKEFRSNISDASLIIATSGHQLISEALSLDIPILLLPLETYEQHYNALMVERYNLGKLFSKPYSKNLIEFHEMRDSYAANIRDFKKKHWSTGWYDCLMPLLEQCLCDTQRNTISETRNGLTSPKNRDYD